MPPAEFSSDPFVVIPYTPTDGTNASASPRLLNIFVPTVLTLLVAFLVALVFRAHRIGRRKAARERELQGTPD